MTTSTSLSETLDSLKEPFPREVIRKLNKGGTSLDYIPVSEVIARLNRYVPNWSIVDADAFISPADPNFVIGKVVLEVTFGYDENEKPITRRHIGYGGQQIKFKKIDPKNPDGPRATVDLGDEFKGAQSDAFKKAAQQLGIGLDLARTDEALQWDADLDAEPATEAQISTIQDHIEGLDGDDKEEFKKWWGRTIGKPLKNGLTFDEATTVLKKIQAP